MVLQKQQKRTKKRAPLLPRPSDGTQELAKKNEKKRELRVDDETHLHPQATKHKEKRKKKRELEFLPRLGDDTHLLPKTTKQKEKRGSWPLSKVGNGAHQTQNQNKK
jgi:hypothetical protein